MQCPVNIRYDHLVAIERCGRAEDGNYYNMRGVNLKHLVDPIDDLFIAAKGIAGITTTGRILKRQQLSMMWGLCQCSDKHLSMAALVALVVL